MLCCYVILFWFDCHFYFFLSTLCGWLLFVISLGFVDLCFCLFVFVLKAWLLLTIVLARY
jgi:hypothetical protein